MCIHLFRRFVAVITNMPIQNNKRTYVFYVFGNNVHYFSFFFAVYRPTLPSQTSIVDQKLLQPNHKSNELMTIEQRQI